MIASLLKDHKRALAATLWGLYAADVSTHISTHVTAETRRGLPPELSGAILVGAILATAGWLADQYADRIEDTMCRRWDDTLSVALHDAATAGAHPGASAGAVRAEPAVSGPGEPARG